jgi:hypothetical protein
MKKVFRQLCAIFIIAGAFTLCACAPADGIDYEFFGPDGFAERKFIYFDNLEEFEETSSDENADSKIKSYQLHSGVNNDPHEAMISSNYDHTAELVGSAAGIRGKSLRWTNRTSLSERIKFDRMFSAIDIGSEYYISLWVYSAAPAMVRLGVFSLSGRLKATRWPASPREHSPDIRIDPGWNEVVWAGYVHEDTQVTQLGFEQTGGAVAQDFYIDDIVLWAR